MANKAKTSKGAKAPTVKKSVQLVETDEAAKATKEAAIAAKKAEKAASLKALQGAKSNSSQNLDSVPRSSVGVERATTSNIVRIVAFSVPKSETLKGLNVLFHDGIRLSRSSHDRPKHASVFMKWEALSSVYCSTQYSVFKDARGMAVGADLMGVDESLEDDLLTVIRENEGWITKGEELLNPIPKKLYVYCKNLYTGWGDKPLGADHTAVNIVDADGEIVAESVYLKNTLTGFSDEIEPSEDIDEEFEATEGSITKEVVPVVVEDDIYTAMYE